MKLPEINPQELERIKKENFRERLEFQDRYVNGMKMTDNAKWSSAQKAMINRKSGNSTKRPVRPATKIRSAKRRIKN